MRSCCQAGLQKPGAVEEGDELRHVLHLATLLRRREGDGVCQQSHLQQVQPVMHEPGVVEGTRSPHDEAADSWTLLPWPHHQLRVHSVTFRRYS